MCTPFSGSVLSRGGELVSDRGLVGNAVPKSSSNSVHSPHPVLAGDGHIDSGRVMSGMHSGLQALCLQAVQQEVLKLQQKGFLPTRYLGQVVQSAVGQSLLGSGVAELLTSNQVVGPQGTR